MRPSIKEKDRVVNDMPDEQRNICGIWGKIINFEIWLGDINTSFGLD
jgi:hypothetical protein